MRAQAAYDELVRRMRETALLASCATVLGWDEETYLPPGGAAHRAEQLALLAGLEHAWATAPRLGELLAEVEGSPLFADPHATEAVNVRELRRLYDRATRLPRTLVEEISRVASLATQEWTEARQLADFGRFRPWLEKIIVLKRREAECLGGGKNAYDVMLDEHEPGLRGEEVARLFQTLRAELVPLAFNLSGAPRRPDASILRREFPVERQRTLAEMTAATVGFDFARGRLDLSTHPFFSTISPGDCRLTTRFSPHSFQGFFATLHEVGHGLYEQGLPAEHFGTPRGEAASIGVHESQARLWENTVGRSLPFWEHFFPLARQAFPVVLRGVSLKGFHFAVNHVEATLDRVGADEVTYNLHILARFELERALVAGDLGAADLPWAWNEAYRHYLGVVPANHAEGCLQDSHWAGGLFGYFPTYTLGNLFAAQLFSRAREEVGDCGTAFARGDFSGLLGWLRDKVYRHGRRYQVAELIEQATGSPPDHRPFLDELRRKYGALYGIA
jgi:carboxypeptidase Taq